MQTDITNQSAEDRFLAWVLRLDSPADMAEAATQLEQAQFSVQSAAYVLQALKDSSLINFLR